MKVFTAGIPTAGKFRNDFPKPKSDRNKICVQLSDRQWEKHLAKLTGSVSVGGLRKKWDNSVTQKAPEMLNFTVRIVLENSPLYLEKKCSGQWLNSVNRRRLQWKPWGTCTSRTPSHPASGAEGRWQGDTTSEEGGRSRPASRRSPALTYRNALFVMNGEKLGLDSFNVEIQHTGIVGFGFF